MVGYKTSLARHQEGLKFLVTKIPETACSSANLENKLLAGDNFVYFDKKIFSEFARMPGQYFESLYFGKNLFKPWLNSILFLLLNGRKLP